MGALQAHLTTAISLNETRKPIYGKLSAGKSLPLSRKLILATKTLIPFAKSLDKYERRLNQEGIPLMQENLIPLQDLPNPKIPSQYRVIISKPEAYHLKMHIKYFTREIKQLRKEQELRKICLLSANMLAQIEAWEKHYACHLSMTKYLMSSMGYSALKGISHVTHEDQSRNLSSRLIKGHLFLLPWSIPFDRKAQSIQAMGVGFLVNDLPKVPFMEAWKRSKNKSWAR